MCVRPRQLACEGGHPQRQPASLPHLRSQRESVIMGVMSSHSTV